MAWLKGSPLCLVVQATAGLSAHQDPRLPTTLSPTRGLRGHSGGHHLTGRKAGEGGAHSPCSLLSQGAAVAWTTASCGAGQVLSEGTRARAAGRSPLQIFL